MWAWGAVVGVTFVLVLAGAGLALVGHVSLEPLRRRARLVSELRFAATLQDMRSVIVLHRELAQELPRSDPWWHARSTGRGSPCWDRDWRGLARWPLARVVRVAVLVGVAGLAAAAVWDGTYAFMVLAGVAVFVTSLDAIEGLAQEADHRDRSSLLPVRWGDLVLSHLVAPTCALAVILLVTVAVFGGISGTGSALLVAVIVVVPAALLGAVGAAVSVAMGAPPPTLFLDVGFPELTTLWLIVRSVLSPLLVTSAFLPIAVASNALADGKSPSVAAVSAAVVPLTLAAIASMWLRSRTAVTG